MRTGRDSLIVERDGHVERYVATVVEREYLPPRSPAGARPFVRGMLMAWNGDLHRGFIITSDDSVSTVSTRRVKSSDSASARPWERLGKVDAVADDGRTHWIGSAGQLRFVLGTRADDCPKVPGAERKADVTEFIEELASYEQCGRYRYRVAVTAEVEEVDAKESTTNLSRWSHRPASIRIPEQDVPGMRITERCPEPVTGWPAACQTVNFWREQTQFAVPLGARSFELSRLIPTDSWAIGYYQTLEKGAGDPVWCCRGYPGPARYTIYAPNGATLKSATVPSASLDTLLRQLPLLGPLMRYNGRAVFYFIELGPYAPAIVDLKLLPCPGVTDPRKAREHMSQTPPHQGCLPPGVVER